MYKREPHMTPEYAVKIHDTRYHMEKVITKLSYHPYDVDVAVVDGEIDYILEIDDLPDEFKFMLLHEFRRILKFVMNFKNHARLDKLIADMEKEIRENDMDLVRDAAHTQHWMFNVDDTDALDIAISNRTKVYMGKGTSGVKTIPVGVPRHD